MIKENIMLIYGGYDDSRLRSDGFLFDTESKQVVRRIDALNFRFDCARNRHCITQYGAVVAIVYDCGSDKMVEISTTDFSITVLKAL